jgi:hypothetical protein
MVKIELTKKHLYFLVVFIFIVGLGFVLAQTIPNPGHSSSQVSIGGGRTLGDISGQLVAISNGNYILPGNGLSVTQIGSQLNISLASGGGINNVIAGTGLSGGGTTPTVTLNANCTAILGHACGYDNVSTGGASQWNNSVYGIYYNSGRVGIGTGSPSGMLHVYSFGGIDNVILTREGYSIGYGIYLDGAGYLRLANYMSGSGIVMNGTGNVGIGGTAYPSESLDVTGNIKVSGQIKSPNGPKPYKGYTTSGGPHNNGRYAPGEIGSYANGNAICNAPSAYPGSRMCTAADFSFYGPPTPSSLGQYWYSTYASASMAPDSDIINDCAGWTSSSLGEYGTTWFKAGSSSQYSYPESCNAGSLPILCCGF